jgi:hypothetical protein
VWTLLGLVALVPAATVAAWWLRRLSGLAEPPTPSRATTAEPDRRVDYNQLTVAAYLGATESAWWTCSVTITATELRIVPDDHLPSAAAVSRLSLRTSPLRYLVMPVVMSGNRSIDIPGGIRPPIVVDGSASAATRVIPVHIHGMRTAVATEPVGVSVAFRRPARAMQAAYRGPSHILPTSSRLVPWRLGAQCSLLHLVGEPVPTASGGWRLRVRGAVSEKSEYTEARGTLRGEELLGPDDIQSGRPSLVVLQAEPVDGPPQPLGSLRQGMVALALGLHDVGVAWVIVMPPLPDVLAERVVQRTATPFDTTAPPTTVAILDLVHDLRGMIDIDDPDRADVLLLCHATALVAP